jgi:hypothetical protein
MSVLNITVLQDLRNVDNKIYSVMEAIGCKRHQKDRGVPCYSVPRDTSNIPSYGVCNHRALAAGMRGHISGEAVQSQRKSRINYARSLGDRIRSKNFPKSRKFS